MFSQERQRRILDLIRSGDAVRVADLSETFSVSESTIRRDLAQLEESGLLERTHGGAVPADSRLQEPTLSEKSARNTAEKMAIARAAAALIQDGDAVILDAGSTTLQIARLLRGRQLTVVTNAVNIAAELGDVPGIDLIVTGGTSRGTTLALVGPIAEATLSAINADWLFLGTNGVHPERGLTTPTPIEAAVKARMIEAAREVVLVADHTKWGAVAFAHVAPLSSVNRLITDIRFDRTAAAELESRGMRVMLAE